MEMRSKMEVGHTCRGLQAIVRALSFSMGNIENQWAVVSSRMTGLRQKWISYGKLFWYPRGDGDGLNLEMNE